MEDASDEDEAINYQAYTGYRKSWIAVEYTRARNTYQDDLDNDATQPLFYTMVQQDAFYGHILKKISISKNGLIETM